MGVLGKAAMVGLGVGVGFGLVLAVAWCSLGWLIDQMEQAEAGELRSA